MALTTAERTNLIKLAVGMFNAAPGAVYLNELAVVFEANGRSLTNVATILTNSGAFQSANPASQTSQEFAASFLTPLGLQANTEAVDFIVARLNAGANKGALVVQALTAIDNSTNAVFANAKAILNNKTAVAENFSVTLARNETNLVALKQAVAPVTADVASVAATIAINTGTGNNEAGATLVLTSVQDIFTGGAGTDFFRAVAGQGILNQDQTTLNSSDILDGAGGMDSLIVNMTGPAYNGGARIKNIETLQVGTNQAASTFDYNVNQGQNEVTEVTKIVADQINVGEQLNIINILATATPAVAAVAAVAAVPATATTPAIPAVAAVAAVPAGAAIPVLAWTNEAASIAGTASFGFRESAVAGTTTMAMVELNNVNAVTANVTTGRLVLGGGVETVTIASNGGPGQTTLNNSINVDGRAVDIVSGANDTVSPASPFGDGVADNSALTRVVVTGERTFGKMATVNTDDSVGQTSFGLTNRVANGATDLGTNDAVIASASNLVSVAGTVTEIDATNANGGVNMRFVSKADNVTLTAVTFKGSKAADYIEFEQGAVNATGGEGNDTFSFVNSLRTSFDFGSNDTLVGGAGDDTIQIGLNGVGNMTLNTTEFNNKGGIETLDLRGLNNTVTLADAFVRDVDAGKTLTVRTDKIVQTSDASTANTSPALAANNAALENNAISTVVLTQLAGNRAINFLGGSGSDRLVVNDASANQFSNLDGGLNAAVNSFDSLTVVNTSVLDANDVFNIRGFELLNLVENVSGNNTFNVEISERFLLANTSAANTLTVATQLNTYGTRLGAGDVVNFEVSNLLTGVGGAAKASIAGRILNVQDLVNAGVTVNYLLNGVATPAVALAGGALFANVNTTTAPAVTLLDDVPGAIPAVVTALTSTAAALTANATTLTGGVGTTDTLTISDAGVVTVGSVTTGSEILVLANGTNTVTFAQAGITSVTGGTGNDAVNLANLALSASANLGAGTDTLTVDGIRTNASTFVGGDGTDTIVFAGGANIAAANVSGFEAFTLAGAGSMTAAQYSAFGAGANAGGGADILTLTTAGSIAGDSDIETYTTTAGIALDYSYSQGAATQAITGNGTANDTVTYTSAQLANDTINLGAGTADTLNISVDTTAAAFDLVTAGGNGAAVTGVEIVNITVAQTVANALTMFNGAATVNASAAATVILGTGGQTFVSSGAGAMIVTASTGVDTFTLNSTGADRVNITGANSNFNSIDVINNFAAGVGPDVLATGTVPTTLWAQTVAAATTTNLVASLQSAISAAIVVAAGNWDATNDAGLITITSFNGAGPASFFVQNLGADAVFTAADAVIQLVGTTGTLTVGDFA